MKRNLLISALILASQASYVLADEVYKCVAGDSISYQSKPCPAKNLDIRDDSTAFDGWTFGSTINQIKYIARDRQLPMVPHIGIVTQKFNDKVLNSHPESREYTYKTKIMDKLTRVTLFFTKTTQELYKIQASFHVVQLKPEERKYFYESLYSLLSKKYGDAKNIDGEVNNATQNPLQEFLAQGITNTLIGTLLEWRSDEDNVITLNYKKNYQTMSSYDLTYKNMLLLRKNEIQTTSAIKQQTNQAILNDANKL